MPLFVYECANGHKHESMGRVDVTERSCPFCDEKAKRIMSAPALRADGAYSYKTDDS